MVAFLQLKFVFQPFFVFYEFFYSSLLQFRNWDLVYSRCGVTKVLKYVMIAFDILHSKLLPINNNQFALLLDARHCAVYFTVLLMRTEFLYFRHYISKHLKFLYSIFKSKMHNFSFILLTIYSVFTIVLVCCDIFGFICSLHLDLYILFLYHP